MCVREGGGEQGAGELVWWGVLMWPSVCCLFNGWCRQTRNQHCLLICAHAVLLGGWV